jgi:hypothetical protein
MRQMLSHLSPSQQDPLSRHSAGVSNGPISGNFERLSAYDFASPMRPRN